MRGHLEQCISDRHTQPCRAADLAVAKSCCAQTRQYFSSSVYGFVVRFAPERGQKPHAPHDHFRVLANETQFVKTKLIV